MYGQPSLPRPIGASARSAEAWICASTAARKAARRICPGPGTASSSTIQAAAYGAGPAASRCTAGAPVEVSAGGAKSGMSAKV